MSNRILTDLYSFKKTEGKKTRYDCIVSTESYEPFEMLRNAKGELFIYLTDVPDKFRADVKRKADKCISKTRNISSIFIPDIHFNYAYGDIRGTSDALLMIYLPDFKGFDIIISRGQRNNKINLYRLLADHELNQEIENLKSSLKSYQNSNH